MIYFLQAGEGGPIKIGFTDKPINKRMATLQTANAEKLTLIATMEGDLEDEKKFKSLFKTYRLNGEWYRPDKNLLGCLLRMALDPKTIKYFLENEPIEPIQSKTIEINPVFHVLNIEFEGLSLEQYLKDIEKAVLKMALEKAEGSKVEAAKLLGLSFRSFRYRLSKHTL